jgi:hypothetical protein
MKRRWAYAALVVVAAVAVWRFSADRGDGAHAAQRAFEGHVSGVTLTVRGEVVQRVEDDTAPPRHQRFTIRTSLGQSILVAHNTDLAPRVPLRPRDMVTVRGVYEWNEAGGVLHNTHAGRRGASSGWIHLERTGRTYR